MKNLQATLETFEDNEALLIFEDKQKLRIPKDMLPGFVAGDIINLSLMVNEDAKEQHNKMLKGILNEIIDEEDQI